MKRTLTIMIAGLAAVFALGACGAANDAVSNGAKGAIESATGCKVNGSDKSAKVECKNGKSSFSVGSGATLPDGFPKADVPLPDGKILSSVSTTNAGKEGYNVTVKVDGSLESAASDYQSTLESKGFTVDSNSTFSLGSGLTAYKATNADWDVNVIGSGGGGSSGKENGLNITVTPHDASSDTSTTG